MHSIDLAVPTGSVYGLLGPNGAGKTTTIHMLLGLVRPSAGEVRLFGHAPSDPTARAQVGYVPEKFQLPPFLTARAFLRVHARLHGGIDRAEWDREVGRCLDAVGMLDREHDLLDTFSKGQQQRIAIAQALLGAPRLIVLDEPTSALDPVGRRDVRDIIRSLQASGTTVILNSHLLSEVEQVCDEVVILERGRVASTFAVTASPHDASEAPLRVHVRVDHWTSDLAARFDALDGVRVDLVDSADVPDAPVDIVVELAAGTRHDASDVATIVLDSGARLLRLQPAEATLEEHFLRIVGAGDAEEIAS